MGGGLMQLVAYGAQDIYLTGNPQITFFKVVYRRHTNFSMEQIQQTFKGTCGSGARVVATVSRNGDLIHDCYIKFNCNQIGTADKEVNNPGHALINNVEVEIGGQMIDRQYGHFMEAHAELTEQNYGLVAKQGNSSNLSDRYEINAANSELSPFQQTAGAGGVSVDEKDKESGGGCNLYVPLRFWFCRHVGLSLPLIALQYHEVNINVTFSGPVFINIGGSAADYKVVVTSDPELWVNYIYLDTDERRRFAQVSHEYLIEQVQEQSVATDDKQKLNFNHPVKELIWRGAGKHDDIQLKLNGHDRFSSRGNEYFELQQPFDYHTAVPRQNLPRAAQLTNSNESVNVAAAPGSLATALDGGGAPAAGDTDNSIVTAPGVTSYQLVITDVTSVAAAANPGGPIISVDGTGEFETAGVLAGNLTQEIWAAATASRQAAMQLAASAGDNFSTFAGRKVRISGANLLGGTNPDGDGILDAVILAAFPVTATEAGTNGAYEIDDTSALVYFDRPVFTVAADGSSSTTITAINLFESNLESISQARTSQDTDKIGVYSFALKPEEHQPSGTCNFSRIDNAELTLTGHSSGTNGFIYAVNYNVLRIMSGMGGLAYSN